MWEPLFVVWKLPSNRGTGRIIKATVLKQWCIVIASGREMNSASVSKNGVSGGEAGKTELFDRVVLWVSAVPRRCDTHKMLMGTREVTPKSCRHRCDGSKTFRCQPWKLQFRNSLQSPDSSVKMLPDFHRFKVQTWQLAKQLCWDRIPR